jgi:hypothetical protein
MEAIQFGSEMAAPVEIEDTSWHRSRKLHYECGWKRGDSAIMNARAGRKIVRLPLVGGRIFRAHDPKRG